MLYEPGASKSLIKIGELSVYKSVPNLAKEAPLEHETSKNQQVVSVAITRLKRVLYVFADGVLGKTQV